MNSATCQAAAQDVGSGVGSALRAVDCAASDMAQAAFARLFGSGGALVPALTILLTIFVALFAFALLTGRSRIGIASLTPKMMTLGLVLTFATSWLAYQSVVWNLATGAPDEIAGILLGGQGSATQVFADKIDVVFGVLVDVGQGQQPESTFSPPGLLWLGATILLLSTVGILATCKIAMAVLLTLGPIFIVLALFEGTRGVFAGWLKGLVMLALAPLFAVLGGSLMLELSVPVLSTLAATPGAIESRAAMAFFMIACVHAALMVLVLKVAATMVGGWTVFGLARSEGEGRGRSALEGSNPNMARGQAAPAAAPAAAAASSGAPRVDARRDIRMTQAVPAAANDTSGVPSREVRVVQLGRTAEAASHSQARARTHGVGSRFRPAAPRPTEKLK